MYAIEKAEAVCGESRKRNITIEENIDARIAEAESRLQELKDTKERLAATGLLSTRIDDLNRAMSY